jgi:hypothetical protein
MLREPPRTRPCTRIPIEASNSVTSNPSSGFARPAGSRSAAGSSVAEGLVVRLAPPALPAEGECIPKIAELGSNTAQELKLEAF